MKRHIWKIAPGLALLAGCTSPFTGQGLGHGGTLVVQPTVHGGSYRAQAEISPYTPESINHVQVRLFTLSGGTETPLTDASGTPLMKDVASASLGSPLSFSNLHTNTTYRVRAFAYGDSATASLISTPDAGSYVDVHVTNDDRPTLTTLPVQLIDRVFSGSATSAIAISTGSLVVNGPFMVTTPAIVTTFAGAADQGDIVDGHGTDARFNYPQGLAADQNGYLYVAERMRCAIRKISPQGDVSTLAGGVYSGSQDATGSAATFNQPCSVAVDASGSVYVADTGNHTIRKINPGGGVTTLAGTAGQSGSTDDTGANARFNAPRSVAVDAAGNVYVADMGNHTIRVITPAGVVATLAGSAGQAGSVDGTGSTARFDTPSGIAVDASGNVYVADENNHMIRKVTPAGVVTTLAGSPSQPFVLDGTGSAAGLSTPHAVAVDRVGNVYALTSYVVRKITPAGVVTSLAGFDAGYADGTGAAAAFRYMGGVAVDGLGNLFVADTGNEVIRKLW